MFSVQTGADTSPQRRRLHWGESPFSPEPRRGPGTPALRDRARPAVRGAQAQGSAVDGHVLLGDSLVRLRAGRHGPARMLGRGSDRRPGPPPPVDPIARSSPNSGSSWRRNVANSLVGSRAAAIKALMLGDRSPRSPDQEDVPGSGRPLVRSRRLRGVRRTTSLNGVPESSRGRETLCLPSPGSLDCVGPADCVGLWLWPRHLQLRAVRRPSPVRPRSAG